MDETRRAGVSPCKCKSGNVNSTSTATMFPSRSRLSLGQSGLTKFDCGINVRRPILKKSSFVNNPQRLVFSARLAFTGGVMRLLIVEDDEKTSGALKTMHLRPGSYTIELRAAGLRPYAEKIYVVAGKTLHLHPEF